MKKKVFIAGPILGMEKEQGYRETVAEMCDRLGFEAIDPWRREKVLYKGDETCWWNNVPAKGFVQRDLEDVEKCDVVVAYMPHVSAGACMELFHAKRNGKTVLVVSSMECLSPWIIVYSDKILRSFEELEEALKQFK